MDLGLISHALLYSAIHRWCELGNLSTTYLQRSAYVDLHRDQSQKDHMVCRVVSIKGELYYGSGAKAKKKNKMGNCRLDAAEGLYNHTDIANGGANETIHSMNGQRIDETIAPAWRSCDSTS